MRIESPDKQLTFYDPAEGTHIELKASADAPSLKEASTAVLLGRAYDTEQQALVAADRWLGILQKAFAHVNLGADFGDRAHKSVVTTAGLAMLEQETGERVLNDVHGISAYDCEPTPRFASMSATLVVGRNVDHLASAIATAVAKGVTMSSRDRLAYDLYAASHWAPTPDARFAMLMMALETLIEPEPRSKEVRAHVEQLIATTRASGLPTSEISSIVGTLSWAKDESIGQAGRKLAAQLGDRMYMDESESAEAFFTKCYTLRSQLFHGAIPRPTIEVVDSRAASLEIFVGHLLSLELPDED